MSASCSCCRGVVVVTPLELANRPGLSALVYRVGTYASFFETMKARLSSPDFALASGALPLARLTSRDPSDPAIALLDAWAVVADVLTFYQERIANEGYLRTAIERQSMVNLSGLVGYALRPGVAASVFLAYTLDPSTQNTIPAGSRVQNTPAPGDVPQSYETSGDLDSSGAWNNLAPRLNRPQVISADSSQVYLAGVTANLKANDNVVIVASPAQVRRVSSTVVDFAQKRTQVILFDLPTKASLAQAPSASASTPTSSVSPDLSIDRTFRNAVELVTPLTEPPADHPSSSARLARSASRTFRPEMDMTPAILKTFNPLIGKQLYDGIRNADVAPPLTGEFHALRVQAPPFGHNAPLRPITDDKGIVIATEEWPLAGSLSVRIEMSSRSESEVEGEAENAGGFVGAVLAVFNRQDATARIEISASGSSSSGVIAVKDGSIKKIGPWEVKVALDQSAPGVSFDFPGLGHVYDIQFDKTDKSMSVVLDGAEQPIQVPLGETTTSSSKGRRTFVSSDKGILIDDETAIAPTALNVVNLDMVYDQIVKGSYVVIDRADTQTQVLTRVAETPQKVSLTNYGMSGRVTQLTLEDPWLDPANDRMLDVIRNTTVSTQSEQLTLAQEPISDPVSGSQIELGDLYSGLKSGRWLIVQGERADIDGVTAAEVVMLDNVQQGVQQVPVAAASGASAAPPPTPLPGDTTHSFLQLSSPLSYAYKRGTTNVFGNVVQATQGESRKEILGSGDGAQTLQQFSLHQGPLTYVAAPNASGTQSTLGVQVNGLAWSEIDTLAAAGPNDRVYTTDTDANGKLTITFGNGIHGMRLPTGSANVIATYRSGIGSSGNADAGKVAQLSTRPMGVKTVTNPVPASGGAEGDTTDQARQNTPVAVASLDRLVSVSDYGDFARSFAGIGKANSQSLSDGHRQVVFVTIAGNDGTLIDKTSSLYLNLVGAFQQLGDPHVPVEVEVCEPMLLVISAQVKVLAGYDFDQVAPQIRAALLATFGFDRQALAESVPLSRVVSAIQNVAGVQYMNVQVLDSIRQADTQTPDDLKATLTEIANSQSPKAWVLVPPAQLDAATGTIQPAGVVFLTPDLPDTLILTEITL